MEIDPVKAVGQVTGLPPQAAAWTAFAALHSGVFLRAQCTAWCGAPGGPSRKACTRIVGALLKLGLCRPVEPTPWPRMLHIHHKSIYRALGQPDSRHRKAFGHDKATERLLALDYILDHPSEAWLPTEAARVAALTASGIDRGVWPHRVYEAHSPSAPPTIRYFVEKWPMALTARRGRAVICTVTPGTTLARLRSWQREYGPLLRALGNTGYRLHLVHISHRSHLAPGAERALARQAHSLAEGESPTVEIDRIRRAVRAGTAMAAEDWGGWEGMMARFRDLTAREPRPSARPIEASVQAWTSRRLQAGRSRSDA